MTSSLADRLAAHGERIACAQGDSVWSYARLLAMADSLVNTLKDRTLVALLPANDFTSLCVYVGCLQRKLPLLLLPSSIKPDALRETLAAYQPGSLFAPAGTLNTAQSLDCGAGYARYSLAASDVVPHNDLALLLTTSGSTGSRKYVRLSHTNIFSNAYSIVTYLNITGDDRPITTLPFSYSYGLSIINSHLLAGATIILTEEPLVKRDFWDSLRQRRATTFGGVPYTYTMLRRLRFARMELPSIRYLTQAGGRLGEELHREFALACADKGIGFVPMYGQTEATARMSYLAAEVSCRSIGSVGQAIPGGRFELLDGAGNVIMDPDTEGELIYYGANVCLGYASTAADLARGDENHGRLQTGDIARCDAAGNYYIVGRKKRFLKLAGNRVNLDELDSLLAREGFSAVSAGKDDALLVYTDRNDQDTLKCFLANHTSLNKYAYKITRVPVIPRSDSGKVLYAKLESALERDC
ncbi:MAG: AMP-binding protein [Coriobacteriales bacterium]|jgi:acyl-CoA synthetase (AMP-forming)/AMP-acid ligase II|nr:AMP-binding protein [Coriobacteriales bacterium]